ncbi:hypothetical protein IAD21_04342 [Abditibacteriota bacterium]|nr:hypothetical protein IAD21_04342 [Abditibacteriota bacterium]
MKFTRKTMFVAGFFGFGACLLWPSIGRSQAPGAFQKRGSVFTPNDEPGIIATAIPAQKPSMKDRIIAKQKVFTLPTEMDKVNGRIDDLEAKIVQQQKMLDKQQQIIDKQQQTIDNLNKTVYAHPAGYTKAFITLGNFSHLPPTDAISYWARY